MNKIYQILLAGALAFGAIACKEENQTRKYDTRWTALDYKNPQSEDSVKYSRCYLLCPEAYDLEQCTGEVRQKRCGEYPSGFGGQTPERDEAVSVFKECEDAQKELEVRVAEVYYGDGE